MSDDAKQSPPAVPLKQAPPPDLGAALRQVRDAGLESAARIVLRVTSSSAYGRATALLAKPVFIVSAITREKTEAAMKRVLSRANMPSRTDVLSLSRRLTHIELALDDLSANVDAMKATTARPTPVQVTAGDGAKARRARRAPSTRAATANGE